MNILPHKSWHVRRRDNIEKVRRDEANAAEEEKKRLKKVALAEQEHRTSVLRARAQKKHVQSDDRNTRTAISGEDTKPDAVNDDTSKALAVVSPDDEIRNHVNFFRDAEQGKSTGGVNKEREAEKKAEQETYEKKIGLLTYLGQSSAESQTVKPWYFTARQKTPEEEKEQTTDLKRKDRLDPMHDMNHYLKAKQKRDDPDGNHPTSSSRHTNKAFSQNRTSSKLPYTSPVKTSSKLQYTTPVNTKHHKEKHKHKKDHKHKKHSHKSKHGHKDKSSDRHKTRQLESASHNGPSIEQLRAERLRREASEKARTERLLSGKKEVKVVNTGVTEEPDGRYNSQFNPEIARRRRHKKDFVF